MTISQILLVSFLVQSELAAAGGTHIVSSKKFLRTSTHIDKLVYKIFFSTVNFFAFLGQKLPKYKLKISFSKFDRAPES